MNTHAIAVPLWSTSSFGGAGGTVPMDSSALGEHLHLCRQAHGRLFALRCVADKLHGVVAPRFMTTLVVFGLVIGVASLAM